ncbi:DUF6541 family protein [Arsenicicoccus dermatophilus]|uniref:DUF6541 family protein n=1 Tax=Arsenicicoccus dermatophilus TaxID=1076331 RepID=UPI00391709EA
MSWVAVWPALLLAAVLVTVPGLVVGAALGLRREPLLGAAPLLSLAAIGWALPLAAVAHLTWTWAAVVVGTLAVAAVAGAGWLAARTWAPRLLRLPPEAVERRSLMDLTVFGVTVAVGATWLASVAIHTIGQVESVQQSYDGVFHVNAVERVAHLGSASPATVAATANTTGRPGFYPPLFHAVAGLLVRHTGVDAVVAANVLAVVVGALCWIPSVALLAHVVLARHRYGILASVVAACSIPLFPALLMKWGVLWPNMLGIAVLPAVLALVVIALGQAATPTIPVATAVVAGLMSVSGLYYAHPGSVFAAFALAVPVLGAAVARGLSLLWRTRRLGPLWVLLILLAVVLVVPPLWARVLQIPALKSTMSFDWPAGMTLAQAFGNALALGSPRSPSSWVMGALAVLGAVRACQQRHTLWVPLAHGVVVYLYMLAAGTDEPISKDLTSFWYNDQYRIVALLPITAAPLVGLGLVWCRDELLGALDAWYAERPHRSGRHLQVTPGRSVGWQWGAGIGVLAAVVWALPGGLALDDVAETIRRGYYPEEENITLVDRDEAMLYQQTLRPGAADGERVVGNPWNGAALAGPLSGRESVIAHLTTSLDADRRLVAARFKELATDRDVCRAVKRLRIGYATEDTRLFWSDDQLRRPWKYLGLNSLANRPGLTPIGHEGTVTVYRVGPCRS